MTKILIVDDDKQICLLSGKLIERMGHQSYSVHTVKDALISCSSESWDLVLLDLELPDGNSLTILPDILKAPSSPEVIIITGTGNIKGAEIAFKYGAWDFIPKPMKLGELILSITRALEYRKEKNAVRQPVLLHRDGIIGESPALKTCLELVAQAAGNDSAVLITGETGTGKELISEAIHNNSARAPKPFVVVDCASLPESLIGSTLFGHEKGSFTGASTRRSGLITQAENGTLFLDEVGELPPAMQKTFLRVLQEHTYRPIGSEVEVKSEFRIISATNRDLDAMVEAGNFRMDLLYRLRSIEIRLPPLRERKTDILGLVVHHLERTSESNGCPLKGYSPEYLKAIQAYDWPGNVRELLNTLDHSLAIVGDAPILYPIHLPLQIRLPNLKNQLVDKKEMIQDPVQPLGSEKNLPTIQNYRSAVVETAEKAYLLELMQRTQGNIRTACRLSGLSESRLHAILKKYDTPRFRKTK